jgi:8-oxo-dGTP pyrophosphatase MutT (NUDIX family)
MQTKRVAKVVVLNPAGEVLLLRRSATDSRRPGEWDFPGGGVEDHESFEAAAAREAAEEAGLTVTPDELELLYTGTDFYAPLHENVHRALYLVRVSEAMANSVTLSFEHDLQRWTTPQQALQDFPHHFYATGLRYGLEHGMLN